MIEYPFFPHRLWRRLVHTLITLSVLFVAATWEVYAQDQVRTYANFQGTHEAGINILLVGLLTGSVTDPGNAIDMNVKTSSSLSVPIGVGGLLSATQFLEFTENGQHSTVRTIRSGTPVTIKATFPREILGLLSNIEIGHYRNLTAVKATPFRRAGYNTDDQTIVYSGTTLLNLINGIGQFELTFSPDQDYHGVFMRLSGTGLSVLLNSNLFHAYIMEEGPALDCAQRNKPIDVLSGTRSDSIGALTGLGGVTDPYNIMEGDADDYATMTVGVGALNTIYLNTIFPTASSPGQNVRIVLERPGGLLDLNLLSSITIHPLLRDQPAGDPLVVNSALLSVRLLPGTNRYELAYSIDEPFDRIELRLNNTVSALTTLRVYEVSREARVMIVDDPIVLSEVTTGCGEIDLSAAIANYRPDLYTYQYYTTADGTTPLPSSMVTASGEYYIEAVDPASLCASERVMVQATVTPLPGRPDLSIKP